MSILQTLYLFIVRDFIVKVNAYIVKIRSILSTKKKKIQRFAKFNQ